MSNIHQMIRIAFTDTKQETWQCDRCERKFVITSRNPLVKIVITAGDEHATHVGSVGGISISSMGVNVSYSEEDLQWMNDNGIGATQ